MSTRAKVVIGANYGDEGKGLMTDYHGAQAGRECIVARFNGGAQAGHTVVAPDGTRHVFSHIGSGALGGATTFLSRHFACHPQLFLKEAGMLRDLAALEPRVFIDDRAPVTTPYDMLINQLMEKRRGDARHGSCGVGFGETVERSLDAAFTLTAGDLRKGDGFLLHRLNAIRRQYLPERMAALGAGLPGDEARDLILADALMEDFVASAAQFAAMTTLARPSLLAGYREVVMEGAQGLLLDQERGAFPHVTRSHTGIRNALALAHEAGIGALDITYCSRAYLTRHGAGALAGELPTAPYQGIRDDTNIRNEFQGALRFAHLDLDLLASSVRTDLGDASGSGIDTTLNLAVTCLDQIDDKLSYYAGRRLHQATPAAFLHAARAHLAPSALYASYGPSRADVQLA
jgi:adenylosuccinate synthase